MSELVKVYAPSGEMFENSPVNARDLVVHAGWSYDKPHTDTAIFDVVEVKEPVVISEPVIEAPVVEAPVAEVQEEKVSEVVEDEVSEVVEAVKEEEVEVKEEVPTPAPAVRGRKKKS